MGIEKIRGVVEVELMGAKICQTILTTMFICPLLYKIYTIKTIFVILKNIGIIGLFDEVELLDMVNFLYWMRSLDSVRYFSFAYNFNF